MKMKELSLPIVERIAMNNVNEITKDAEQRMVMSIKSLTDELAKLRTGRAHPNLLDHVKVSYYGNEVPLTQVASITAEGARSLAVTPWEKTIVGTIEKAIRASDLGLNPTVLGTTIRIPLPPLNEERRKELVRVVHEEGEKAKIAVRNIRRDANQHIKDLIKDKKINEDEEHRSQAIIQKLTDKFIADVDKSIAIKEKDLLEI